MLGCRLNSKVRSLQHFYPCHGGVRRAVRNSLNSMPIEEERERKRGVPEGEIRRQQPGPRREICGEGSKERRSKIRVSEASYHTLRVKFSCWKPEMTDTQLPQIYDNCRPIKKIVTIYKS